MSHIHTHPDDFAARSLAPIVRPRVVFVGPSSEPELTFGENYVLPAEMSADDEDETVAA